MTHDRHVLACALWVEKHHGDRGPVFIAERIGTLALERDADGATTWRALSDRFDALQGLETTRRDS